MISKKYFRDQIDKNDRFTFKTPVPDDLSAGIQTVEINDRDVREVKDKLFHQHRIDCRPMSTHDLNGLRISLSVFNTKEDIDYLVQAMEQV